MWESSILARPDHQCPLCPPASELPPLSAYLRPEPAKPPVENEYYVVSVNGGAVLSNCEGSVVVRDAVNSDSQRWRVVYGDGDGGDWVALRSVWDDRWLKALDVDGTGRVSTSDERQWWILEEGPSPGSCWLKCSDFPDAYLCNGTGSDLDGNGLFASQRQLDRAHAFTWNLREANAVGYDSKGWALKNSFRDVRSRTDPEARERAVVEKERKLQGLEDKHSALAEKEKQLAMQQADFQKIMESHRPERRVALLKAENDSLHLQLSTSSLEREVEKVKERSALMNLEQQLRRLENEKAQLQNLLHSSRQAARLSPSPTKSRNSTPTLGSPSTGITVPSEQPNSPTLRQGTSGLSPHPQSLFKQATGACSLPSNPVSSQWPGPVSPRTPTRKDMSARRVTSHSQIPSESSFGGWLQSERNAPTTPSKHSNYDRTPALDSPSDLQRSEDRSPGNTRRPPSSIARSTGKSASFKSVPTDSRPHEHWVSLAGPKFSSQSTPAKSPPRMDPSTHGPPPAMRSLTADEEGAVLFSCGHKIYKPPRKLNKNIVGYVYE